LLAGGGHDPARRLELRDREPEPPVARLLGSRLRAQSIQLELTLGEHDVEGDHTEQRRADEQHDRGGRETSASPAGTIAGVALTDDAQIRLWTRRPRRVQRALGNRRDTTQVTHQVSTGRRPSAFLVRSTTVAVVERTEKP
jgi:hypothetical protein